MASPTLLDWAATQNNQQVEISKSLIKSNGFLQLAPAEAVVGLEKRVGRVINRTAASPRGLNQGTAADVTSRTNQYYKIALFEKRSEVDSAFLSTHPDPAAYRLSEDLQQLEAIRDGYMSEYFYGDTNTDPNGFNGFGTFASSLNTDYSNGSAVVLGAGGTGSDLSSAYAIKLGSQGSQILFNSQSGATPMMQDMGEEKVTDSGGTNSYFAATTKFSWHAGAQYNIAGIGRLANLEDGGAAGSGGVTVALLNQLITYMKYKPDIILVNRFIKHDIDQLIQSSIEYQDRSTNIGEQVTTMNGVMIMVDDNITQTETAVA